MVKLGRLDDWLSARICGETDVTGPEYLVFPLAVVYVWILVNAARRRESLFRMTAKLGTAAYIAAVSAVTFFPLPVQAEVLDFERQMQFLHNQFAVFGSIGPAVAEGLSSREMLQALANVVMFVPVGILVPILGGAKGVVRRTLLVAAVGGIAIEIGQFTVSWLLGFTYKVTDVDDVILNIAGAILGLGLFTLVGPLFLVRVHPQPSEDSG